LIGCAETALAFSKLKIADDSNSQRRAPAVDGTQRHNAHLHDNLGYVRPEKRKVVRQRSPTENLADVLRTRVPELPSIANDRHQQPPAA
jgi:hypothetical protein